MVQGPSFFWGGATRFPTLSGDHSTGHKMADSGKLWRLKGRPVESRRPHKPQTSPQQDGPSSLIALTHSKRIMYLKFSSE